MAVHEAGHAVVMSACDLPLEEAFIRVDQDGKGFEGHVSVRGACDPNEEYEPIDSASSPCKPLIYINALSAVAGFVAENVFKKNTSAPVSREI